MLRAALVTMMLAPGALASAAEPPAAAPTALITGANRGIGLALAREYAARGWQVIATARRPSEAADLQELAREYPRVAVEALDVSDHAAIDRLAAKYRGQAVDLVLNNAGISGGVPTQLFGRMDYASFRNVLEVNTIGPLKMAESFTPHLLAAGKGKLVTLSTSEASFGRIDSARLYWYRASKAAVNMLMLNLAYELKPRGIAVALINPGPVDTDMMKGVRMPLQKPADAARKVAAVIDGLGIETTGKFLDYRGGELPW